MLLAMASIFACLGVLVVSNAQPTSHWHIQPSEYLAVFTAIANLAMRYGCIQGVVVAWWMGAIRGFTLSKMHWDWRSGTTLVGALTSGRQMGWLGLACIASTLVAVDVPLLQRSTRVISAPINGDAIDLNVTIAAEVPRYYGGFYFKANGTYRWSPSFNASIPSINGTISNDNFPSADGGFLPYLSREFVNDAPLTNVIRGCVGSCATKLTAPALSSVCETHRIPVNYTTAYSLANYNKVWSQEIAAPSNHQAFMMSISLNEGAEETLNLVTGWSETNDCVGSFTYTVCTLASAIGEYDVSITDNKAILDDPGNPRIIALANNTKADHSGDPFSTVSHAYNSSFGSQLELLYTQFETVTASFTVHGSLEQFSGSEDVIAAMNKLMVYMGVKAGTENTTYLDTAMDPGWPVNTTTVGVIVGNHNVYKSEFRFFIAAAVIEIICIIMVAPTYWGRWRLGRPCSFSPLEVAKAFNSPLLTDVSSNSSGRDLAKTVGEVHVQYGTAQCGTLTRSKLVFGDPTVIERPQRRAKFDV